MESYCPACGDLIDACYGHGEIGDPMGAEILASHDREDHAECHPYGCESARVLEMAADSF